MEYNRFQPFPKGDQHVTNTIQTDGLADLLLIMIYRHFHDGGPKNQLQRLTSV